MDSGAGTESSWDGPGAKGRTKEPFRWRKVVWALIYPRRNQHMVPTVSGVLLIALSLGIGTAAYNSSNNILFITLALLLACLILSGVLSWLNFSRLRWRLLFPAAVHSGQDATISLEVLNGKKLLPTYGLNCTVTAVPAPKDEAAVPETTFTARGKDVKAIFKQATGQAVGRLAQTGRLDPAETAQLDWTWMPARRGRWQIELQGVGSFFPFGFFNKKLSARLRRLLVVWPAVIPYQRHPVSGLRWSGVTERLTRAGSGSDLLALRRYAPGDSHRLINWKASARTGQMLVRQFAAETTENYTMHLHSDAAIWPRPEQFERFISLAASLAVDMFRADRLHAVIIDEQPPRVMRHGRDLAALLDDLACLEPRSGEIATPAPPAASGRPCLLAFAPDGNTGVIALIDGNKAATA